MKYIFFCFLCLALAGVFLYEENQQKHSLAVVLKGLASLCFVMLGILGSKMSVDTVLARHVVTGLCLGMIADVLLNLRFVFKENGQKVFLLGILIFLGGHVMYIIALIPKSGSLALSLIIGAVLTAVLIWWIFQRIMAKTAFKVFGVFYLGAIMIMTCLAFSVLLGGLSPFSCLFAIGAVMFLGSDIILILNTFGGQTKESLRISNIVFYYIGQLLIASSLQFI